MLLSKTLLLKQKYKNLLNNKIKIIKNLIVKNITIIRKINKNQISKLRLSIFAMKNS